MDDQREADVSERVADEDRHNNSASSTPLPPEDGNVEPKADSQINPDIQLNAVTVPDDIRQRIKAIAKAGAEILDELTREELLERVQRQISMLQKLKARYDDRNNKCKTMADEIGQLETSLKEARRHNEQLQVDLKAAASAGKSKGLATMEIEEYQRTIDLLQQRIGSKQKSMDVLNDELEQLRSLNSKIQNDHAGVQLANSTLAQQLEKERSLRAELEAQLVQARDVHASVRNEMATKFADVEEMRTELEHEKLGKHKLTLRIAELEDIVSRQSTDAANLRQANEKTCADAERLKDQLYRVEQEFKLYKLKAQRAVKDNYVAEGTAASHDTSRATSNIVALETELGELQRKYETEQNRLRQAHDAVTALKAENRILRQEQQQQNAAQPKNIRLTSLSDGDSGADSELSTSSKFPANDKNRRASVIERDYDELLLQKDQQIRAVSTSHAELTSENSRLKRQIDELTSQINNLKQKLYVADRSEAQNSDRQRTNRIPSVEISVQTDGSLFQRLSPERNHQPQKSHPRNNAASRQRSLPQRQGSRRNSDTPNHSVQSNGFADRRVMYNNSRNSVSGDDQSGAIDDEDDEMAADDTKSSTSTLSQSASQVLPRARSRQNTLSYSTSSFEDLLLAPVTIQTSKIDYESNHANCMNELLTESQAMNRHLSTQIAFLKDEVRRLEANAERLNHVHNMEYLKNVLLKFLTHTESVAGGGAEREHLVEVLATMLKLTKQERKALLTRSPVESVVGGAHVNSGGGGEWTGLFGRLTSVVGKK